MSDSNGNAVEARAIQRLEDRSEVWRADWRSLQHLPIPTNDLALIHLGRHNEWMRDSIQDWRASVRPNNTDDLERLRRKELEFKCWLKLERTWRSICANAAAFDAWWQAHGRKE